MSSSAQKRSCTATSSRPAPSRNSFNSCFKASASGAVADGEADGSASARVVESNSRKKSVKTFIFLTFPAWSVAPVFALGAMLEPLLERFVSDHEPEPLRCSRLLCPFQIQAVEGHAVRH